jgi:hypothetical protein
MQIPTSGLLPSVVLLVAPTGGGKSLVRDVVASASPGVTLSISPLLALGADQESNLNLGICDECGAVAAFHVDEILNDNKKREEVLKECLTADSDSNKSIILFASPQATSRNEFWRKAIVECIKKDKLNLVCIDEVHLFCSFGMSFRDEIYNLKDSLFENLLAAPANGIDDASEDSTSGTVLKCPLLLMTATATKDTVDQFTLLSGIALDTSLNVFWPAGHMMCRREMNLIVEYTTSAAAKFKERATTLLEVHDSSKIMLYSNSRLRTEKNHESMLAWMNEAGFHGDSIVITGQYTKEEKFHRSRVFANTDGKDMVLPSRHDSNRTENDIAGHDSSTTAVENPYAHNSDAPDGIDGTDAAFDPYNPRILVASIDAISAGVNVPTVREVYLTEFACDTQSLLQASGRVARYEGASPQDNIFVNYISLEGLVYLIRRLYLPDVKAKRDGGFVSDATKLVPRDQYRLKQLQNIHEMVRLLVLPTRCLAITFEMISGNPYLPTPAESCFQPPCGQYCSFCRNEYYGPKGMFPLLSKRGIKEILMRIFIGGGVDSVGLAVPALSDWSVPDGMVKGIQAVQGSRKLLFGGRVTSDKPPEPVQIKKVLLLLYAAEILLFGNTYTADDKNKKNPIVIAQLNMSGGTPCLFDDEYWKLLPLQSEQESS